MNPWNSIETPPELRKWTPRQPSPELRARIFGLEAEPKSAAGIDLREISRWVVPAFGCFLLAMASLSPNFRPHTSIQLAATNFALPPISEETGPVALPDSLGHSGINSIPARKLEWSFGTRPAAQAMGSILVSYTNKLIQ